MLKVKDNFAGNIIYTMFYTRSFNRIGSQLMSRLLITLLLFAAVLATSSSCKRAVPKNYNISVEADDDSDQIGTETLTLNRDTRWKVDLITNANVQRLQGMLQKFDTAADHPLGDYEKLKDDLQHGIDKMISECNMTGPGHEALHKWLKPLIDEVQQLKKATTAVDANRILKTIDTQMNLYSKYFEV